MSDIEVKRAFVADLYPGQGWKKKVRQMPESQVIAIYIREEAKLHSQPETPKKEDDDIPF